MKNTLYIGIGSATLIAGATAYFLLSENGKDILRDIASGFISKKTGVKKRTVKRVAKHVG